MVYYAQKKHLKNVGLNFNHRSMTMKNKEAEGSCVQSSLDKAIPQNDLNIKRQFMFGESLPDMFISDYLIF